jgi:hypothetical protein
MNLAPSCPRLHGRPVGARLTRHCDAQEGDLVSGGDERDREVELWQITVGEVVPHAAPVQLSPYDPAWPLLYAVEATTIRGVLGDGVLGLEHVGSTSPAGRYQRPVDHEHKPF